MENLSNDVLQCSMLWLDGRDLSTLMYSSKHMAANVSEFLQWCSKPEHYVVGASPTLLTALKLHIKQYRNCDAFEDATVRGDVMAMTLLHKWGWLEANWDVCVSYNFIIYGNRGVLDFIETFKLESPFSIHDTVMVLPVIARSLEYCLAYAVLFKNMKNLKFMLKTYREVIISPAFRETKYNVISLALRNNLFQSAKTIDACR